MTHESSFAFRESAKKGETTSFTSITQDDIVYNEIIGKRGNSVSDLFSIITACNFIENGDVSLETHLRNIDCAVANYLDAKRDTTKEIPRASMNRLCSYIDSHKRDEFIETSCLILNSGGICHTLLFDTMSEKTVNDIRYVIIFTCGSKNVVVLVTLMGDKKMYSVRDCDSFEQQNVTTEQQLCHVITPMFIGFGSGSTIHFLSTPFITSPLDRQMYLFQGDTVKVNPSGSEFNIILPTANEEIAKAYEALQIENDRKLAEELDKTKYHLVDNNNEE